MQIKFLTSARRSLYLWNWTS